MKIQDTRTQVMQVRDLGISFGSHHVLNGFDFDLYEGENLVVLGKSGSGKSVLIKCIIGLLQPDAGDVTVFGDSILGMDHDELDRMRAKVGFLFQSNALYDSMTVRENLEFPLRRHWIKASKRTETELVMEALESVGLVETVDMMPSELSGGMRKRIALARTLILKPKIILYDEPTTGLDPITGREISNLILEIQEKYNTSSVIISHDMNCVKIAANRIALLMDGTCQAIGTYDELRNSGNTNVSGFFD